ncbi:MULTISPECIES: hypothetical protein [unclassified Streptomyces]|jgi:hypothetical protein|uniref:hypothetical protein n=1 Tax=Streptomyces TaxID=1883 RepID=UPI001907F2BC|nr:MULTISPECIES: hypothetical protein [unclassified Streptomyces]MCU4745153.1 hypothetical protein [Streptomyces sp. G-5]QQN79889.1 hypothetical protein IPZ77_22560 [Streptomyces sp. XC 2026]
MIVIAVTGHMDLADDTLPLVRTALREAIAPHAGNGLVGISCIARGADSLFADVVLELGGKLVVVVPSRDYRQAKVKPGHAADFDRLSAAAGEILVMPYDSAGQGAYVAANAVLLERADRLIAVWDGVPPTGKGGTADVVEQAREAGLPVEVIWPGGARRAG